MKCKICSKILPNYITYAIIAGDYYCTKQCFKEEYITYDVTSESSEEPSEELSESGDLKECLGCQENQPNQLAHMDYGGCLCVSSL